jgi:hypothetical protein
MALTTVPSPRRSPVLAVAAIAALVLLLVAGCSSSADDAASSDSTFSTPSTSTTPGSGTTDTTAASTSTTDGPIPTSPSTLPDSFDGPCAALAETIGLDQIQPRNTSSWFDERQRIVVDAQREAQLLGAAQQGAPADIATRLVTMQVYASWLATTVQGAADYSAAVAAVESYPDMVSVSLAIASVQTWQKANCPE